MDELLTAALSKTRLLCGAVELKAISLVDVERLADVATGVIHTDDYMPFGEPWSAGEPAQRRDRLLRWYHSRICEATRDRWTLLFEVSVDGRVVGSTNLYADRFPELRTLSTGSWLLAEIHGRGVGTLMRRMLLNLAFGDLGAEFATSEAWEDNWPSRRVNEKCSYTVTDGYQKARNGFDSTMLRYRLDRADWMRFSEPWPRSEITIDPDLPALIR